MMQTHAQSKPVRSRRSTPALPHRGALRAARHRGVIIVIALLSVFLLAGLVVHVVNLGQQVNRRVEAQHSADAAAAAGAGWIARGMNTVSMNNVAMARLIALVPVLDAMPMAIQFTTEDQTAAWVAVTEQLSRGVSSFWTRDALVTMRDKLREELDILEPMDQLLNQSAYDVREMTFYDGPAGRGRIWRALEGLDEYNQAVMENLGVLAQVNAIRGGEVNLNDATGQVVLMPILPDVPWELGRFEDFRRPVLNGLLPTSIDDKHYNRGPWDVLKGWRYFIAGRTNGYWSGRDCTRQITTGGRGTVPIGRGVGAGQGGCRGGTYVVTSKEADRYGVYGPYAWMIRHIHHYTNNHLRYSRFRSWVDRIASPKRDYLWRNLSMRQINDPEWLVDFPDATQIAEAGDPRIVETAFIAVEIKSKYPVTHPSFGIPGTWAYVEEGGRHNPRVTRLNGWMDPRLWGVPQIDDYIWRDEWTYEVNFDTAIGIGREQDDDGRTVRHTVYRIDEFVFAGINIGESVDIRDPNPQSMAGLPKPTFLDHGAVGRDLQSRRNFLTVLAVAQRSDRALMWNDKFSGNKPYPNMVAMAQAHVFNNHSWDLFTQMWHAQLQPVSEYDNWLSRIEGSVDDAGAVSLLSSNLADDVLEYMRNAGELANVAGLDASYVFPTD